MGWNTSQRALQAWGLSGIPWYRTSSGLPNPTTGLGLDLPPNGQGNSIKESITTRKAFNVLWVVVILRPVNVKFESNSKLMLRKCYTTINLSNLPFFSYGGSWEKLTERRGEKLTERRGPCTRALVRTRLRLPSVYPCGDCSRSQFFVDGGVSNGEIDSQRLASSCRGQAHGTLVVPAIAARRTPRLLTSLGNDVPLVDEEGYPYLVR